MTEVESVRVLIVEDHLPSQLALARLMRHDGFHVKCVSTVAEGKASLADFAPNVVLLNLMLPDGNGAEILREIRDQMLPVRVAVVSGAGEHMLEEVAKLYPEVIIRKPIDIAGLLKWVREQGAREDRKTA